MENAFQSAGVILDEIREYIEVRIDEAKLDIVDKASTIISTLIARTLLFLFLMLVILFISMAAAFALGQLWGRTWMGFLAIGGVYIVLSILLGAIRERAIRIPVLNNLLLHLTKRK